jgi:hypothetical protein
MISWTARDAEAGDHGAEHLQIDVAAIGLKRLLYVAS